MASHKSAQKCIRKTARQTLVNKNRVSRIRTEVRKVERMLESPKAIDQATAQVALVEAERQLMRGVSKGMMHKNTAARKVSRLAKKIKAIA
ncbi:MAG: 30S ribosomal protein S20 [Candidatus Paracaedibacteraceae bacterium]|nr:30S ribosomal protein S20 [Candidatus Paracaedibacteraceae bacterium]